MSGKTSVGPPCEGQAWDDFVRYWIQAMVNNAGKSMAWRAFHAGYVALAACKHGSARTWAQDLDLAN